jgi:Tol biopolymer transport system component
LYISHWVGDIYTMDSKGANLKQLTHDSRDVRGLDWSMDGRQIVFASKLRGAYELRVMNVHGGGSTPLPSDTASASDPAVSQKGGFIAFVESEENWNIWRASLTDGHVGKAERFLASSGQNHSPSFSPDGKTIASESRAWCFLKCSLCLSLAQLDGASTLPSCSPSWRISRW